MPSSTQLELFAIAAPSLEPCLFQELAALVPSANPVQVPGGVTLRGDLSTLYRVNLWTRLATRVLVRVGTVTALHFEELRRKTAALRWSQFVQGPVRLKVSATAHRCRLIHTGALAERVEGALADAGISLVPDEDVPLLHVLIRGESDRFTLSVDSSGELLHRRGYRQEDGGAPLRETLAPALLMLAGFQPTQTLCDPMCGSATLAIEAAHILLGRAPGLSRRFAFFDWPGHQPMLWQALVDEARAQEKTSLPNPIVASDRDPDVIELARRNAERAGVLAQLDLRCIDIQKLTLPKTQSGLILCNPPYGKRLKEPRLVGLYRSLGMLQRRSPGFGLAILTTQRQLAQAAGTISDEHWLRNGGLRVGLFSITSSQRAKHWPITAAASELPSNR